MMRFLLFTVFTVVVSTAFAQRQAWLHPQLEQRLSTEKASHIRIGIYLNEQLNTTSLKHEMAQRGFSAEDRGKHIVLEAFKLQKETQADLLLWLKANQAKQITSFWAVNMLVADIDVKLIPALRLREEVSYLFADEDYQSAPIEPTSANILSDSIEVANGTEPGLRAINAPAMWNLGYTGRGRKAFTVDTGTWTDHPALNHRFLGNYGPLSQAWFSLISDVPIDRPSHHGTHVNGTILGLDTATRDTIGVAFNSYFMASNPLTVNNLTPLTTNLLSFQWALNPDGDSSTASDMPDVINNSWGQAGGPDTSICNSWASQLFNVVEAAGIAITFSAGNEGPGASTVKHPQFINTNEVNIFSIGAVDGNNAALPIASFSSKGPSLCGGTGSRLIKPEVVAPGVNVRSAYGQRSYGLLSGTSMSCPHVSGAVLLLKEAFPQLGGDSLLYALYVTAIDKGDPGEDNTFGNGMIDVYAAYQYLALRHTAAPPRSRSWDAAIGQLLTPSSGSTLCAYGSPIQPQFELLNRGDSTLTQAILRYRINGGNWQQQNWQGSLAAGNKLILTANQSGLQPALGLNEIEVEVELHNQITETDRINNRRSYRFTGLRTDTLLQNNNPRSYFLPADSALIRNGTVAIQNPDNGVGWDTVHVRSLARDSAAWVMQMTAYSGREWQVDRLITPAYFGGPTLLEDRNELRLKLAYRNRAAQFRDSLRILLECDCGNSRRTLYYSGGDSMKTYGGNIPTLAEHWRNFTFLINEISSSPCNVVFETKNDNGGNLYIGDMEITVASSSSVTKTNVPKALSIYPNPSRGVFTVELPNSQMAVLEVRDSQGRLVKSVKAISESQYTLDLSSFADGVYLVRFYSDENIYQNRIMKQ